MNPQQLLFAETHEWVHVDRAGGDRIATIGITSFAVEQLTDLVYMELPAAGTNVAAGEEFGEVESVKAVSPLYSPVGGEVVAVNTQLVDQLDTLTRDPYGEGWVIRVKMNDEADLTRLMDWTAYQKQCADHG